MKTKILTGTVTALLIAATTSLAMAQGHHGRRLFDSYGARAQSQEFSASPASPGAGIEQER